MTPLGGKKRRLLGKIMAIKPAAEVYGEDCCELVCFIPPSGGIKMPIRKSRLRNVAIGDWVAVFDLLNGMDAIKMIPPEQENDDA